MDEFENSHRFHFFLSSEVLLLSQNYHGYASNPKLESEKTGRRYLDPLAEILGATSSVYFLPKVVSYATLLESKTHPGAFLPSSLSSSAETTSRMFVGPSFPRGLLLLSLALDGGPMVQMRIFESAKKIIRWIGNSSPSLLFIGRVISKRDAESRLITFPSIDIVMGRSLRRNRRNPVGAFAASATSLLPAML